MTQTAAIQKMEQALIMGDLEKLSSEERLGYYQKTCESLGLNPLTKPFEYVKLNNKLTLYARKDATDQLRKLNHISIDEPKIQFQDEWIIVTVIARTPEGRTDSDLGVVGKKDMGGNFANALMKAVTKSKRRVTLSICGLGFLDETEVETIPQAVVVPIDEPKQIEAGPSRDGYLARIQDLCTQLNSAGDDIKWSGKTLAEYTNTLFSVEDGVDSLSFESLQQLVDDLEDRKANLLEDRRAESLNAKTS